MRVSAAAMQFSIDSYSSRDQKEVPYAKRLSRSGSVIDSADYRFEMGLDGRMQIVPEEPPPVSPPPKMQQQQQQQQQQHEPVARSQSLVAEVPPHLELLPGDRERLDRRREDSNSNSNSNSRSRTVSPRPSSASPAPPPLPTLPKPKVTVVSSRTDLPKDWPDHSAPVSLQEEKRRAVTPPAVERRPHSAGVRRTTLHGDRYEDMHTRFHRHTYGNNIGNDKNRDSKVATPVKAVPIVL